VVKLTSAAREKACGFVVPSCHHPTETQWSYEQGNTHHSKLTSHSTVTCIVWSTRASKYDWEKKKKKKTRHQLKDSKACATTHSDGTCHPWHHEGVSFEWHWHMWYHCLTVAQYITSLRSTTSFSPRHGDPALIMEWFDGNCLVPCTRF
jgi:hypothetical protein